MSNLHPLLRLRTVTPLPITHHTVWLITHTLSITAPLLSETIQSSRSRSRHHLHHHHHYPRQLSFHMNLVTWHRWQRAPQVISNPDPSCSCQPLHLHVSAMMLVVDCVAGQWPLLWWTSSHFNHTNHRLRQHSTLDGLLVNTPCNPTIPIQEGALCVGYPVCHKNKSQHLTCYLLMPHHFGTAWYLFIPPWI